MTKYWILMMPMWDGENLANGVQDKTVNDQGWDLETGLPCWREEISYRWKIFVQISYVCKALFNCFLGRILWALLHQLVSQQWCERQTVSGLLPSLASSKQKAAHDLYIKWFDSPYVYSLWDFEVDTVVIVLLICDCEVLYGLLGLVCEICDSSLSDFLHVCDVLFHYFFLIRLFIFQIPVFDKK